MTKGIHTNKHALDRMQGAFLKQLKQRGLAFPDDQREVLRNALAKILQEQIDIRDLLSGEQRETALLCSNVCYTISAANPDVQTVVHTAPDGTQHDLPVVVFAYQLFMEIPNQEYERQKQGALRLVVKRIQHVIAPPRPEKVFLDDHLHKRVEGHDRMQSFGDVTDAMLSHLISQENTSTTHDAIKSPMREYLDFFTTLATHWKNPHHRDIGEAKTRCIRALRTSLLAAPEGECVTPIDGIDAERIKEYVNTMHDIALAEITSIRPRIAQGAFRICEDDAGPLR